MDAPRKAKVLREALMVFYLRLPDGARADHVMQFMMECSGHVYERRWRERKIKDGLDPGPEVPMSGVLLSGVEMFDPID